MTPDRQARLSPAHSRQSASAIRCRVEPFLYQGGACGAASGAPRAGLRPWGGPARRARAVPAGRHWSDWLDRHAIRCSMQPTSSRPIVPVAAARSRARFARRCAIGVPPTLDLATARKGHSSYEEDGGRPGPGSAGQSV